MGTVTGFTAERMQEIEDAAIVDGNVNGSGNLILVRHDLTQINAGSVIGPVGPTGPAGPTSIMVVANPASRPNGGALFVGLYIYEISTKLTYVWDGTSWLYRGGLIICTSSTRPSNPIEGLPIYETDTDRELIYNGIRFDQAWNMPWGVMDRKIVTAGVGPFSAETDLIVGNAVTYKANRWIKITLTFLAQIGTVPNDFFNFRIKEGATLLREIAGDSVPSLGGAQFDGKSFSVTVSPTAASHTYKGTGLRTAGSGNVTVTAAATSPIELLIEDIGPNGAPV